MDSENIIFSEKPPPLPLPLPVQVSPPLACGGGHMTVSNNESTADERTKHGWTVDMFKNCLFWSCDHRLTEGEGLQRMMMLNDVYS